MRLFYQQERNFDFFNACEKVRKETLKECLSATEVAKRAILTEAQSFYLLDKEIAKIIYRHVNKIGYTIRSEAKKAQYKEIMRRYYELHYKHPQYNIPKIAKIIANQKAPRFYITENTAMLLYYKLLGDKSVRTCNMRLSVYA